MVLPQSDDGEVIPTEVQPPARIARSSLVRIMSKVVCAGSASAKVTTRFLAISRGSGSKAASSAQAGPTAGARPGLSPPARDRRQPGLVAAALLGLLDGGLDAFHASSSFAGLRTPARARARARAPRPRWRTRGRAACSRCAPASSASGITPSATTSAATTAPRFQRVSEPVWM